MGARRWWRGVGFFDIDGEPSITADKYGGEASSTPLPVDRPSDEGEREESVIEKSVGARAAGVRDNASLVGLTRYLAKGSTGLCL